MFMDWMQILDLHQWFVLALLMTTLIFLIKEIFPIDITLFSAGILPVILGIVPTDRFFQAIANETIVTITMLFIVVKTFESTGLIHLLIQKGLPKTQSQSYFLLKVLPGISFFSAFLNNTPIVMMVVPMIKQWCQSQKLTPSLFLIPISFAAILGGVCTLIGTSTNLLVNGLLQSENQGLGLSFFEIGMTGLPCACVGLLFLIVFSKWLLPKRLDPDQNIFKAIKEMVSEHVVTKDCSLIGKTLLKIDQEILKGDFSILQIQRGETVINAPKPNEKICEMDRLTFVGNLQYVRKLYQIQGLQSIADPHFSLDGVSSHYFEYMIMPSSNLIGRTLVNLHFRTRYKGSVFAICRKGRFITGNIKNISLKGGDVLMVLSSQEEQISVDAKDMLSVFTKEDIPIFSIYRTSVIVSVIIVMIILATFYTSMMMASIAAAFIFILAKLISPRKAIQSVNWNLLITIIGGFSLSFALESTELTQRIGEALHGNFLNHPSILVGSVFLITTMFTELITNTAAVLILFPIFSQILAKGPFFQIDAMKGLAITVAIAASCSFLTPVGYQTNTIVYAPGGYKYRDFFKIGLPLNFLILLICSVLVPIIYFFP